jgi:hypothetical protein
MMNDELSTDVRIFRDGRGVLACSDIGPFDHSFIIHHSSFIISPLLLDQPLDQTTRWLLYGVVAITILLAVVRPMFRRKDPLRKPPAFASLAQQRSVERQMQNVLVEMAELARQISAQMDTRASKLEVLLKEADQKIATLQTLSRGAPGPAPAAPPAEMPADDPRHVQVYELADQGRTPQQIAQQLNRPSGEIELILALRR